MDDDLNLWASDNEACEEREGGQRIVTTRGDESRGVKCGDVAWDTQVPPATMRYTYCGCRSKTLSCAESLKCVFGCDFRLRPRLPS
jgi:hypothetical protein